MKSVVPIMVLAGFSTTLVGCGKRGEQDSSVAEDTADALAHRYVIVDTHIDVPYRLQERYEDVSVKTERGDFDYPRAVAGGLDAAFMSIYVPASYESSGAKTLADELIDMVKQIIDGAPEKFALARTVADVRENFDNGRISLAMGMENGAPIEGDLDNLLYFFDRGVRYVTLVHSASNHLADSSFDVRRPWGGLSPFAREVIAEMNRLGIMIDVSHMSEEAFYQTVKLSRTPVIASHSSARHFTPGFERNMSDDMIRALADNGGVIQINFGSGFLIPAASRWLTRYLFESRVYRDEHNIAPGTPEANEFRESYRQANPFPYADISDVLDHIDHVVSLVGVEHVGLGSDFDGVGDSLPAGLKDVSAYPNLVQGLIERGHSDTDIEKILSGNLIRVWSEVEAYAAER